MGIVHAISFDDMTDNGAGYALYNFTELTTYGNVPRAAGRYGGYAFSAGTTGTIDRSLELPAFSESLEWNIGFDFYYASGTETDPRGFFDLLDHNSARMCRLALAADGSLKWYRGNGATLIGTTSTLLSAATWYFIEMQFRLNDTTGYIQLKIDDVLDINVTGTDTLEAGVGLPSYFLLGSFGSATGHREKRIDNLLIRDDLTWMGPLKAEPLTLTADTADKDFLRSTGSDNYALIDETVVSETDYIYSGTPGDLDLYTLSNLSDIPEDIAFVQTMTIAEMTTVGTRVIRSKIKSGSSTADGDEFGVTDSADPSPIFQRFTTDPATGVAWTKSGIDGMTAGVEVVR
jgi:hypothetical protein